MFIENLQNKKITTLSVYSLLGKHIATISNPGSIINLNDYNLSNGVYFIEINKKYYSGNNNNNMSDEEKRLLGDII